MQKKNNNKYLVLKYETGICPGVSFTLSSPFVALRKTILTNPPFTSYSGSATPCALQASTIRLTPDSLALQERISVQHLC